MSILKLLLLRVFNVEDIKTKISDTMMIKFDYVIATCSLFAKHYNYTENQSDLMYHQVSEIKLDHLPKLSSHSNLN